MATCARLLYLHGFLSSPQSFKARQVAQWLAANRPDIEYHCPHLTPYPDETAEHLLALAHYGKPLYLMGSSLGGFWATWLAEQTGAPAVLINPAVSPWQFMPDYLEVDLQGYHTDDTYRLDATHVAAIQRYDVNPITCLRRLWLLVQQGDETLDFRQAVSKYQGAKQTVEPGGDHSFQGFERYIPDALAFFEKR
ncbi:YqiA/YcfP family alpha/beta fold hydrolase [Marinimicrobium sp. ARAG 43.8]|uniref:YqiA/YcfP family alpha/beta fold hydrolase n=1 Tax=Marinimicrobium sp. ARAG 43.8 TaxID=3418719 RepID=UPI003CF9AADE